MTPHALLLDDRIITPLARADAWGRVYKLPQKLSLYVSRPVLNAAEIIAWAKAHGFKTCLLPEDMHVTICFSKAPLVWPMASFQDRVHTCGDQAVELLGDDGAAVLKFSSTVLQDRHQEFRGAGASWDHESYNPHITLSYDPPNPLPLELYMGPIELGPEIFAEVISKWASDLRELVQGRVRAFAFDPSQPRDEDGKWTDGGGGSEAFEREVILSGGINGARRQDLPIQSGIKASSCSGFGDCVEQSLAEHRKNGSDVYVGVAVRKVRYDEALSAYKKDGAHLGTEAIPHSWNVVQGKIVDRTLGSSFAKEQIYFGVRVPESVLKNINSGKELAQWHVDQPVAEYALTAPTYAQELRDAFDEMEQRAIKALRAVLIHARGRLIAKVLRGNLEPRGIRLAGLKDFRMAVRDLLERASARGGKDARKEVREGKRVVKEYHTPGGHGHDQQRHAGDGGGGRIDIKVSGFKNVSSKQKEEMLSRVDQELTRLKDWPVVAAALGAQDRKVTVIMDSVSGTQTLGWHDLSSGNIEVRPNVRGVGVQDKSPVLGVGGDRIGNYSPEDIFRHEVGHAVHHKLPDGGVKNEEWRSLYTAGKNAVSYAGSFNEREYFAESFSAYTHPSYKTGDLPTSVESYLQKHVGSRRRTYASPTTVFRPRSAARWMREKEYYVTDLLDKAITETTRGILVNGLKTGELNARIADKIWTAFEAYIGDPTMLRDGEPLAPSRLETIVRTNLTDAYNHGRMMEYTSDDMLPFLNAIRYSAILDERTTPCCAFLDGKLFDPIDPDLTDLLPPNHFNCRSIVVPVVVGEVVDEEDFITPEEVGHARELADAKFLSQEEEI